MLNVRGKNASDRVIPIRMPAAQGLEYVHRSVRMAYIPPPSVIYIDTAHTYPETIFELEAAWALLRPGGFLTGDDYTHFFPPVQQALNEWVLSKPPGTFVPPTEVASRWGSMQKMRLVRILTPGQEPNATAPLAPFVLRLPGQWVLRKPLNAPSKHARSLHPMSGGAVVTDDEQRRFANRIHRPLSCCLNGWANPDPEPFCSMGSTDQHSPKAAPHQTRRELRAEVDACINKARAGGPYYTRCNPAALPLQQRTCNLPAARTWCITNFRCRELGKGAAHGVVHDREANHAMMRGSNGKRKGGKKGGGGNGAGKRWKLSAKES